MADGLRCGALSHGLDGAPEVDLLAVDWLALADRSLDELRAAFGIVAKLQKSIDAGSVGPWEPGGISDCQWETARAHTSGLRHERQRVRQ